MCLVLNSGRDYARMHIRPQAPARVKMCDYVRARAYDRAHV